MKNKKDIVILSTADWDNPFWTNKQHVAVALSKLGYRVFYIDSLGLRRPSINSSDLSRIKKRFKKACRAPIEVQDNIWVWSPIVLPFQGYSIARLSNKLFFSAWLSYWLKKFGFKKDLLWTYNPLTTRLLNTKDFSCLVYHCVDEIKAQPGMPVEILEVAEEQLCMEANIIFATAPNLYQSRKKYNNSTYYFSNVADFEHFNRATLPSTRVPSEIQQMKTPIVGFVGAISGYKVDFGLIEFVAKCCSDIQFVLIGKIGEGDPWTNSQELEKLSNVHLIGPRNYRDLPGYLKGMTAAMLPNHINEYTDSMFPMKFFEYLASGKPVVSVALKAIQEHAEFCYIAKTYEQFVDYLRLACNNPEQGIVQRIQLAKSYTYDSRMIKMMEIVEENT